MKNAIIHFHNTATTCNDDDDLGDLGWIPLL